uniref:B30.2/SPRY domain-containing protein n=1 Tax=Cyprinodon variegatus TaxID=28743 RepID=A0A3Q2C7Z5_CYPVA
MTMTRYSFIRLFICNSSDPGGVFKKKTSRGLHPDLRPRYDTATFKGLCEITMDPNTLNNFLFLSEENRKVTVTGYQCYSNHPDRFSYWRQVLCRESLTGRHYWEVEWRGMGVYVAVAYKSIGRAGSGNECRFGCNDKSWALECFEKRNSFVHNNIWTPISATTSPRIGVYLDHSAGILCFYSVSETMTLLHRVQTTFTEPLHAGLYLELLTDAEFSLIKSGFNHYNHHQ